MGSGLTYIYSAAGLIMLWLTMKGDSLSAIFKKHLDEERFLGANSLLQGATYVAILSGTALGGLAIVYFSSHLALILLVLAIVSVLSSMPVGEESSREKESTAMKEMASAIGFYRKILGFVAVAFVLNGLFQSLDVYSSGLFHLVLNASPVYYTAFVASISGGGIAGSLILSRLRKLAENPNVIALLVLFYAPTFVILGVSRNPLFDVFAALAVGILLPVINVPLQTKLMKVIPRNIYGKVMAFLRVFIGGSTPALAAVLSFIAIFMRVDTLFLYIGLIIFPVAAFSFMVIPRFMELENSDHQGDAAQA